MRMNLKKLLSVLLTLAMVISMMPTAAFATEEEENSAIVQVTIKLVGDKDGPVMTYNGWEDCLDWAETLSVFDMIEGETAESFEVTLLQDVTVAETLTIDQSYPVTLDLNGKTITGSGTDVIVVPTGGDLTIQDSSDLSDGKIAGAITNAGKLSITGGNFTDESVKDYVAEGATVTINGESYTNTPAESLPEYVVLPDGVTVADFGDNNTVTDGTTYYATLTKALQAVYGEEDAVLYCKPGADVGVMTHGAIKASLTVYGNGAYTSGNGDFDIGNCNYQGKELTTDITLTVKYLDGCGAWGYKNTEHTVNIVFENCEDMSEVYLSGTAGETNITMTDCEFTDNVDGGNCKVYSNANGTITLTRVLFSGVDKAVNMNHKVAGTQNVILNGCTFTNCGDDVASDEIPVRVLSSVEGGTSVLTVSSCTFSGTPEGGADILLDYGLGVTEAEVSDTAATVVVETAEDVGTKTEVEESETLSFTNAVSAKPVTVVCVNGHEKDFDTLDEAMRYGESCGIEKVVVHKDITESMDYLEGNITTDNPDGVTIKNTIVDEWIYCGYDFTIGEGVTYDATGYGSGLFVYADDAVINGTVLMDCYYQRYADTKLTINEPGSMTVKTETFILRYTDGDGDAGIYIVGDNNDETIGLNAAVIYFYQGCINAKNADIKVGTYWQTNETDGQGSANLVLDNSKMIVTVNEHNMKATGNSTVTLTNGSNVSVAGGYEGVNVEADETSSMTKNGVSLFVAEANGQKFMNLQSAVDAGGEVILLSDVELTDTLTVSGAVTLDLAGKTISQTKAQDAGYAMIVNDGNLTIEDSVGGGKISYADTTDYTADVNYTSNTITNKGVLTVKSGTIENVSSANVADYGYPHAIDVYPGSVTNIIGGTVKSANYDSIRMFCNSTTEATTVNISGGEIVNRVTFQNPNGKQNVGVLNITGGTFTSNDAVSANVRLLAFGTDDAKMDATISGGTFDKGIGISNYSGGAVTWKPVTGGTFSNPSVIAYLAPGYTLTPNSNGTYGVEPAQASYVASVNGVDYTSLQDAVDAIATSGTIYMKSDAVLTDTLTIPAGKTVILEMNGKTISQTKECTASYEMISNNGSLTITGNGKISFTDTGVGDPTAGWGSYTIRNAGKLVVENGTIENLSAQNVAGQAFAHTTLAIFQYSGSTVINGGKISTPHYRSLRLWSGDVTINGGEFVGQVWVHCVNDTAKMTINGGTFAPAGNDGSSVFVNNSGYDAELSVAGGSFATRIGANDVAALAGAITGGSFTEAAMIGTNAALVKEGFSIGGEADANGYYGLVQDPYAITSLADLKAFRDAVNAGDNCAGETWYLAADIDLNNEEWTPIGTSSNTFNGMFDGRGHTISNLRIDGDKTYVSGGDNDNYKGLFGYMKGGNTAGIKNLTIQNANVTGCLYVGVILGRSYTGGIIENCHVKGNIVVDGYSYIGGIVGRHDYSKGLNANGVSMAIYNCSVDGATLARTGSSINGDYAVTYIGGIVGFMGEGDYVIDGCSVKNVTISGTYGVGGVSGIGHYGNTVSNSTVDTVAIVSTNNDATSARTDNVGLIVGACQGTDAEPTVISGAAVTDTVGTVNHTDGTTETVTNLYGNNMNGSAAVTNWVAGIGSTVYLTLAEAIAAAQTGETVTLLSNVEQADGIIITDKNLTIDLNGKTYAVTEGASTNNRNFKINGTSVVTITNGTMVAAGDYSSGAYGTVRTEGTASVTLTDLKLYNYRGNGLNIKALTGTTVTISDTEIYSEYGGGIESAGGTIELTNVTVEQKGMYTAPYNSMAISVNGGGEVTVNSGTYTTECLTAEEAYNQGSSHGPWAIGVLNSGGTLIVNGGTFSNDNFGDNTLATAARGLILADTGAVVEINGGTFNALKGIMDIQNNLGDATKQPSALVTGGTFSADPTDAGSNSDKVKVPEGFVAAQNPNGTWGIVVDVSQYVATVNGTPYKTIAEAIAVAQAGDTVKILAGTYAVPSVKPGITIEGEVTSEGEPAVLLEGTLSGTLENLTLKNLHIKGADAQRWAYAKGDCVFENVIFEATSVYALHFDGITAGTNLLYKDCTIIGWAAMGGSPASCVFDGCTIKDNGTYGVIHTYFPATIKECTFDVDGANTNDVYQDGIHAVGETTVIKVENCTNTNGGMKDIVNVSGLSVVDLDGEKIQNVAKTSEAHYLTLAEALTAAQNGDTVTLLRDIALAEGVTVAVGKAVILELNGKVLSRNTTAAISTAAITNNGTLTIQDSVGGGKITAFAANPDTAAIPYYASNTITNCGVLTVKSGTIENSTSDAARAAFPIDNNSTSRDAIVNIEGGTITGRGAIRQFANSTTHKNEVNITGGTVTGSSYGIWVQNPGSGDPKAALSISEGTVAKVLLSPSSSFDVAITGGTISEVAIWEADTVNTERNPKGFISGGTFKVKPADSYAIDGYEFAANSDGTYGVVKSKVAEIRDSYNRLQGTYTTLADALADVKTGDTVVLLRDVTESFTELKNVTLTTNVAGGVTVTNSYTNWVDVVNVTIGKGVTLAMENAYYTDAGVNVIEGTLNVGTLYHSDNAKTTVQKGGNIVTTGMIVNRYHTDAEAGIYIYGDGDASTVEVSCGDTIGTYSGTFYAEDAVIKGNMLWIDYWKNGSGESDSYSQSTPKFVDSVLNVTSELRLYKDATLTLEGTCVTAGKVQVRQDATPIVTMDSNSVIKATTVENLPGATLNAVLGTDGTVTFKVAALLGSGTETDPYLISNLEELILFRDSVNAGETKYSAPGVYVALAADIDMSGINWVGIGSATADHGFMGNFDGKTYKIKNLTITNPALDSDGYAYAGLFSITEGTDKDNQNTIKNLTIENVTISTTGHIVAAAVAYPYYTKLDNIKVCGDISITGRDYTAGVIAYTRRCTDASNLNISGNTGSTITGNQVVGGVIADIQMNGGLAANYSNFAAENITVSGEMNVGGISGIIAGQTLSTCSVKNVVLVCEDARVGIVSGSLGAPSTVTNATVENVIGASALIGGTYDTGAAVQAQIGDTYYATLEKALAAAQADETITLLAPVVVKVGETLTIDKDVTITYTSNVPGEDMFTVRGTLNVKAGKLTYVNTDTTAANVTVSTISCEPGSVLEISGGTVENKTVKADGSSIYSYAIDLLTNGNLGDVTATISGGTVYSDYMAIRQFNNGDACKNTLTISGGYIYGAKRAVQVHFKNNAAYTTISGGEIEGGDYALCFLTTSENLSVTGGKFTGSVWYSGTDGFISGGTFDEPVEAAYCSEGYIPVENTDGTYGVKPDPTINAVAKIGESYFTTLADALTAAQDGETVTLIWNEGDDPIAMNGSVVGNKTVTITGTAQVDWSEGWLFVGRGGDGNGKLIFKDATLTSTEASLKNGSFGIHVSMTEYDVSGKNNGEVVFENSTIDLSYLMGKNNVTVDGGKLTIWYGFAVGARPASETNNVQNTATMTVKNNAVVEVKEHNGMGIGYESNGVLNIENGAIFKYTGTSLVVTANGTVNVNGGTLTAGEIIRASGGIVSISGNSTVQIDKYDGAAVRIEDGAVLSNSWIKSTGNGTTRIYGSVTFNGGFETGYLTTADADEGGTGGTITIADDTTVKATYGVDFRNTYTISGGTIELSGGNASGAVWGFVMQDGEFVVNSDIVVTGNTGTYAPIHFTDATVNVNSTITQRNSGGEPLYIGSASTVTLGTEAVIDTLSVHGSGKLIIDADGITAGEYANVKCGASGFTGTIEVINNADLYAKVENGKIVLVGYVASITDAEGKVTKFATVTEAIEAAQDGDTVQLLPVTISEYIAPWAADSQHTSEKSITIVGAKNFGTILTGGLYLGYDDSGCREHTITVKGIAFEGKGVLVAGQQNVVIEGNKFTNITECVATSQSANANAISVIGKNVNAIVKGNIIDTVAAGGIHLRDVSAVTVNGNTVTNVGDNAITVNKGQSDTTGTVTVTDNTLTTWGTAGEGRALRSDFGSVTITGNVMTHTAAPEQFVKATGTTVLDVSKNYWNGVDPTSDDYFAADDGVDAYEVIKNYYTDAEKTNLVTLTKPAANVAEINGTPYATVAEALLAAQAGQTVVMTADSVEGMIVVPAGVGLDLNGKTLEATYVVAFDGSNVGGDGVLKCTNVSLSENNAYLPYWVEAESGYKFISTADKNIYAVSGVQKSETNASQMKYVFRLSEALRNITADGAENDKLEVLIEVSWIVEGTQREQTMTFKYKAAELGQHNASNYLFVILTGLEDFSNLSVRATIMSAAGVRVETEAKYHSDFVN